MHRTLLVAALALVGLVSATGGAIQADVAPAAAAARELSYDDFDTLFKDVHEHPEWFGFNTVAEQQQQPAADSAALALEAGAKAGAYAYTYSQSTGRFTGPAFNGGSINVVGCSGAAGSCRNNPSCQCQKNVGPLPQGGYAISSMMTFKGMPYCYVLTQTSGNACGRSGFLIHGGSCSANPSEGCIVISDQNTRYLIKGGGTLTVTA